MAHQCDADLLPRVYAFLKRTRLFCCEHAATLLGATPMEIQQAVDYLVKKKYLRRVTCTDETAAHFDDLCLTRDWSHPGQFLACTGKCSPEIGVES